MNWIRDFLRYEPAAVAWLLNGGLAMLVAYAFHFDHAWQAGVATVVTLLAALYSALRARPAHIQVAVGILASLITAAATFGYHVPAHTEAIVLAVASIALGFLYRQNVSPVAAPRKAPAPEYVP